MRLYFRIILFTLLLVLQSCMIEQRIAYRFQEEIPQTIILYQNSADVFLINSKVDIPNDISENEYNRIIDSAYYASDLIKHIDANEFGEALDESLHNSLQETNFIIYPNDSISSFITHKAPRIIIDVVQVEVEEHFDEFYEELSDVQLGINSEKYLHIKEATHTIKNDGSDFNNDIFSVNILRNSLSINLWIKVDIWDKDSIHNSNTIFMTYQMNDDIEGMFIWENTEKVNYLYTIDSLQQFDLWKAQQYPAPGFVNSTMDYIVNIVLDNRILIEKDTYGQKEWKYSMRSGRILSTEDGLPYTIIDE